MRPSSDFMHPPIVSRVVHHCLRQRFVYVVLPATLLLTWLVILGTNHLTGRESTEDAGSLVSVFYAVIPCVLAMALTVLVKTHVDITRPSEIDGKPAVTTPVELFISRASTIGLIWLFLHFIVPK